MKYSRQLLADRLRKLRKICILIILSLILQMILPFGSLSSAYAGESGTPDYIGTDLPYLTKFSVTDGSGNPFPGTGGTVPLNSEVRIRYDFTFPDDTTIDTATTYTSTLPNAILITKALSLDLKMEDGTVIGTATVGTDNIIRLKFNDKLNEYDADRTAWFRVESKFREEIVNGEKEIVFPLGGNATVTVPIGFQTITDTAELGMEKSGTYDAAKNEITWTLKVKPKTGPDLRPLTDVVITDKLQEGQTYVDGSATISKKGSAVPVNGSFDFSTSGTIKYKFNEAINTAAGEEYTITFKTKPDISLFNGAEGTEVTFTNKATATFTDGETPGTGESKEAKVTTKINYIEKTGVYDPKTKSISWTVTINNNYLSISNAVITDKIPKGLTLVEDSVKVDNADQTLGTNPSYVKSPTDPAYAGTLTYRFGEKITGPHTLSYTTKVDLDTDTYFSNAGKTFTNTAVLTGDGVPGNPSPGAGTGVDVPSSIIAKAGDGYDAKTHRITWKIIVNSNRVEIKNPKVTDLIPAGQKYVAGSFTVNGNAPGSDLVYTDSTGELVYTFPGDINTSYEISYQTEVTDPAIWAKNNKDVTFSNTAVLTGDNITKTSDTGEQKVNSTVLEKTGAGYDYVTREITWQITVNSNEMPMKNVKIVDAITDGQAFVPDSVTIDGHPATKGANSTMPDSYYFDSTAGNNGTLYYNFPATINEQHVITFKTKVVNLKIFEDNGLKKLQNTAILTADEIPGNQEVTGYINIENTIIGKSGDYKDKNDYIDWGIILNQNSLNIKGDAGKGPAVTDTLPDGLVLDTGSIKLHKMTLDAAGKLSEGEEVPVKAENVRYDLSTNTLTFTFSEPIDGPYRLSFRTDVAPGYNQSGFTNAASLNGFGSTKEVTSQKITVKFQEGDAGASGTKRGTIAITKVDAETKQPLGGAVFQLIDPYGNVIRQSDPTDNNGITKFNRLTLGVNYTIKEVAAPTGYVLNGTPYTFQVTDSMQDRTLSYTAENTIIKGNLKILKWNETKTDLLGGATFALYKKTGGTVSDTPAYSASTGSTGIALFENIPYGTYELRELKAPDGYIKIDLKDLKKEEITIADNGQTKVLNLTNKQIKGSIKIVKLDQESSLPLANATFSLYHGWDTSFSNAITTKTTGTDGIATFPDLPYGTYLVKETGVPEGYLLNETVLTFNIKNNETVLNGTIRNTQIKGNVEVKKISAEDNKTLLQGAVFTLTNKDDTTKQYTATSGDDGIARFANIPYGHYTLTETKAPAGYVVNTGSQDITINSDGQTIQAGTVTNTMIRGKIAVAKQTDSNEPLQNATFTLYRATDTEFKTPVATAQSNASGIATFDDILYGDYVIKETSAPAGYILDTQPISVSVTENGATVAAGTAINTLIRGDIQVTKAAQQSDGGQALTGAVFTLYDAADTTFANPIATATSGSNGIATFTDIPYGSYIVKETTAPEGYLLDTREFPVTVSQDGVTVSAGAAVNALIRGDIQITKMAQQSDGGQALAGAVFTLYDAADTGFANPIATATSGSNGIAAFTDIPYGSYVVKETTAPEGYLLDTQEFPVTVSQDGVIISAGTAVDTLIRGDIQITKVAQQSDGGQALAGAVFTLYKASDTAFANPIATATSGSNGIAAFTDIPYGSYIVKETTAPEGYLLDTRESPVTVSQDGVTVSAGTAVDALIRGHIQITKVAQQSDGGQALAGAVFTLYDAADTGFANPIATATSGSNGIAAFTDIPYGSYVVKETTAPEGYLLNDTTYQANIQQDSVLISLGAVENILIRGDIQLTKVAQQSDGGQALAGAVFTLYDAADTGFADPIATAASDSNGIAAFTDVPYGSYVVKETTAPEGYLLNDTIFNADIQQDGTLIDLGTVENTLIRGDIKITKNAAAIDGGAALPGVVFSLYNVQDTEFTNPLQTKTSGQEGIVSFENLPYGQYVMKEISTLTGYVLNGTPYHFNITEDGTVLTQTIVNEVIRGTVKVQKLSGEDRKTPLVNTQFGIFAKEDTNFTQAIALASTDIKGIATFENIPYGEYVVKETQPREGFTTSTVVRNVVIAENDSIIQLPIIYNYMIRGNIQIEKISGATGKALAGAEFTVYAADDLTFSHPLVTATSNDQGKATFYNLLYGDYVVKETKAPAGYDLNTGYWEFSIREDGKTLTAKVTNTLTSAGNIDKDKDKDGNGSSNNGGNTGKTGGKTTTGKGNLPKTGEYASYLFTGIGSALILLGFALWLTQRRKTAKR